MGPFLPRFCAELAHLPPMLTLGLRERPVGGIWLLRLSTGPALSYVRKKSG